MTEPRVSAERIAFIRKFATSSKADAEETLCPHVEEIRDLLEALTERDEALRGCVEAMEKGSCECAVQEQDYCFCGYDAALALARRFTEGTQPPQPPEPREAVSE